LKLEHDQDWNMLANIQESRLSAGISVENPISDLTLALKNLGHYAMVEKMIRNDTGTISSIRNSHFRETFFESAWRTSHFNDLSCIQEGIISFS
jgi:hypothetical protein